MKRKFEKLEPLTDHGFSDDRVAIAWAAGLFEGEGCFSFSPRTNRPGYQPRAQLATTDRDVVLRFQAVIGCGSVLVVPPKQYQANRKTYYAWAAASKATVIHTIMLLSPYLCGRRRERAIEVLAIAEQLMPNAEKTHCKRGHPLSGPNVYRWRNKRLCRACGAENARTYRREVIAR